MNRILLIMVGIFALLAVSPAFSPAFARYHLPYSPVEASEATPDAAGAQPLELAPRVARCAPAPGQHGSALCLLERAIVTGDVDLAPEPESKGHRLMTKDPVPPRTFLDDLLRPPKRG